MKDLWIFVFVDALGWELVQRHGFLADELPHRQRCDTVFGYSSSCDPTILTGAMPAEHGHFSFFRRAQGPSPFGFLRPLRFLPPRLAENHRVRNRVSRHVARRLGATGYFQLYGVPFGCLPFLEYSEMRDIYEPGGILNGQPTIFARWETEGRAWYRSDWRKGDAENFRASEAALRERDLERIYLFTSRPDAVMHKHGPDGPEAAAALREVEDGLRRLLAAAREKHPRVGIAVFGDHGMARVRHGSDLRRRFEALGGRYGQDHVVVWDSTMARFWFMDEAFRRRATDWLTAQTDGRLLDDATLERWGCLFPRREYGELFYLLPEGSLFVPSFMNRGLLGGMHGYAPEDPASATVFLSNAPAPQVTRLDRIHAFMADPPEAP